MTSAEIMTALADPEQGDFRGALIEEVLFYLDHGMHDEWDIGLFDGIREGFGAEELQIAARSGMSLALYHEENS
jgi:hypothetical protein